MPIPDGTDDRVEITKGQIKNVFTNPVYLAPYMTRFLGGNINRAGVAGRTYVIPFFTDIERRISKLNVEISVLSAGQNIRLGLYDDNGRTPQGAALLFGVDSGNISTAAAGIKSFTFPNPITIKGFVWAALETSDATMNFLGYNNSNVVFADVAGEQLTGCHFDQAFGALPTTCPAVTNDNIAAYVSSLRVDG